jgi:hypothetical protein
MVTLGINNVPTAMELRIRQISMLVNEYSLVKTGDQSSQVNRNLRWWEIVRTVFGR